VACCALSEVRQAAASRRRADHYAVVADVEAELSCAGGDVDVHAMGLGVAGDVAQRLAQHGLEVVAHVLRERVDDAGEAVMALSE
jgi:hypothetical protein